MSVYNPPTFSEYLSVFNPANWVAPETGAIDTAYLNSNYARYPTIQGSSYTMQSVIMQGNLQVDLNSQVNGNFILGSSSDIYLNYGTTLKTVNPAGVDRGLAIGPDTLATQDVNKITFEGGGNNTSLVINNNTNINVNSENSTIIGTNTATALSGSTDFLTNSVVIGSGALSATTGSGEILDTVAIGNNALLNAFNSAFTKNNTAIGSSALSNFNDDGMNNTALGYKAGSHATNFFTGGENNTFLGANTQVNSVLSGAYCNHSTALGCDSIITADNQIVLGSNVDSVIIPNILTFSDGSSLGSATAIPTTPTTNYFKTFSSSPQTIPLVEMISNYFVNYTGGGNLILRLPTAGNTDTTWITIYNYSLSGAEITVSTNLVGRLLTGRFGSSSTSVSLKNNQWIKVAFNTADSNWYVVEKSFVNPVEFIPANFIANSINTPAIPATNVLSTTQLVSYANTIVRASNNAFGTAIIADTVYKPFNCNSNFYFENTGNFNINLQLVSDATFTLSTNTFGGSYGSGTNSLIIPPRTYVQIFIPISNASAVWIVQLRVPDPTYDVAYSGTTITAYANSQYFNSKINLTGSVPTTFNLPDPRQSVNPWATNKFINISNNGSGLITLNSTSGNFLGAHGNGFTTTILPDSSTFYLTSDGTNWNINERSADITFRNLGLASSGVSYVNNNNYLSANLHLSLASAVGSITWLDATAPHSHLTTTKVYNVGLYQITLNATITTDGTFLGKYGSGTSSLIIPANTWVELFSDGTNWLVNDRSADFPFLLFGTGTDLNWSSDYQYLDSKVMFVPASSPINTNSFTGTLTQSGYIATIASVSVGGSIPVGGIITPDTGQPFTILAQITGTAGTTGTYLVNISQVLTSQNFTAKGGTGVVSSGTTSATLAQTTNLPVMTLTPASNVLNPATVIGYNDTGGRTKEVPFYIHSQASGTTGGTGSYRVTTNITLASNPAFFSTSGTNITIPNPSSVVGRSFTIINTSNNPINILTGAGGIGGAYAQITASPVINLVSQFPVIPLTYLLSPKQSLYLVSNGTIWETIEGTTLGGSRSWIMGGTLTTSTVDNTFVNVSRLLFFGITNSNLYGLYTNTFDNGTTNTLTNFYPCAISIFVLVNIAWNAHSGATTTSPVRLLRIVQTPNEDGINGQTSDSVIVLPFTLSAGNFSSNVSFLTQTLTSSVVLQAGETLTISFAKISGNTTAQTGAYGSVYITRLS
jgi:hypothetical protein